MQDLVELGVLLRAELASTPPLRVHAPAELCAQDWVAVHKVRV